MLDDYINKTSISHTPTKRELQDIYAEVKDGDNNALATFGYAFDNTVNSIEALHTIDMQAVLSDWKPKDMHMQESFIKHDSGKNMLSLIEPHFIQSLGEVLTFGAAKYAKNNWQLCEDTSRYKDALLRHIYAYLSGEIKDPESNLDHLAHAAFGLMCLQYFDNLKETN